MEIEVIEQAAEQAKIEWKQYCTHLKNNQHSGDYLKVYKTLKNSLYYLSKGKRIIDLTASMKLAGLNEKKEPKLAIARANQKWVYCRWYRDNGLEFADEYPTFPYSIFGLEQARYEYPQGWLNIPFSNQRKTPVPIIPASLMPDGNLKKYHILWEVEKWEPEPPKDPLLLKQITGSNNLFVILGQWDLTKLERAVIRDAIA